MLTLSIATSEPLKPLEPWANQGATLLPPLLPLEARLVVPPNEDELEGAEVPMEEEEEEEEGTLRERMSSGELTVLAARNALTVFHSLHDTHLPIHLTCSVPHSEQKNTSAFGFDPNDLLIVKEKVPTSLALLNDHVGADDVEDDEIECHKPSMTQSKANKRSRGRRFFMLWRLLLRTSRFAVLSRFGLQATAEKPAAVLPRQ